MSCQQVVSVVDEKPVVAVFSQWSVTPIAENCKKHALGTVNVRLVTPIPHTPGSAGLGTLFTRDTVGPMVVSMDTAVAVGRRVSATTTGTYFQCLA